MIRKNGQTRIIGESMSTFLKICSQKFGMPFCSTSPSTDRKRLFTKTLLSVPKGETLVINLQVQTWPITEQPCLLNPLRQFRVANNVPEKPVRKACQQFMVISN